MTVEELLESPYSPDLWQLARDNCQEIMEKFTQTFPVPKIPMPDNTTDDDWTSQYINKKDLLRDFRYQNPVTTEWPYNGHELPKYGDSNGWLAFLDKQQQIHSIKQSYLESGDTAYLFVAFITCYKYGFYPPLWVIDHWLFPAFCSYSHYEGKKSLETCLGLKGIQRSGNMFHKEEMDRKRFYIMLQMYRLRFATGLTIQKCSEILSMKQGLPTPSTIATMYKKNSKDFPKELLSWEEQYKKICDKLGNESIDNPFSLTVDPRKVFEDHRKHFFEAANSNRPDITVTIDDYNEFAHKINEMLLG